MKENLSELLAGVKNGVREDYDSLKMRYAPLLSEMASGFEASGGGSRDELLQEAESALLKAAITYDENKKGVTFGLYAKICIRNALISQRRKVVSRRAKREGQAKKQTLRSEKRRLPSLPDGGTGEIVEKIESLLSDYEKQVFREYMSGKAAGEIAAAAGKSKKSVENAVFRIRDKVARYTESLKN